MALSAKTLRAAAASNRLAESDAAESVAEESDLMLRSVRDLRRIHSHLASFAYPILHRPNERAKGIADLSVRAEPTLSRRNLLHP